MEGGWMDERWPCGLDGGSVDGAGKDRYDLDG